jgi:ribose 5-phosphate isomerase B
MEHMPVRIAIDSDDAATELKEIVFLHLVQRGHTVSDLAQCRSPSASYPEIGYHLARAIQAGRFERGILLCGTGLGMAMIANKVEGVYAGVCHDTFSAERLKKSNDAQVLTMGSRVVGSELAKMIVDAWLASEFQGGGSAPKVARMRELERESFRGVAVSV